MKITCYILKRDRTILSKRVGSHIPYFEYNNGIYQILAECVNVSAVGETISSVPELYYVEDVPQPVNYEVPQSKKPEAPPFLEQVIIENAIEGLAGGPSELFKFIREFLMNPARLLIVVFALIILLSFFLGYVPI